MTDAPAELEAETDLPAPEEESGKMSFLQHLDEFRRRMVRIAIYLGVGFVACFFFARPIFDFLSVPIKAYDVGLKLVFTSPTQPLMLYIKVAFLAAIFLTIPLTLYEVWKFIAPGLYRKEKRFVVPFMFFSVLQFVTGGAFCYYIVLPRAYSFLLGFGESFIPMVTINEYLSITNTLILSFGLVFEMPVVVAFLSIFGLVTARFLWAKFKYAVLLIFIVAAVISPTPDAVTQCLYAGPMIALYIISIGIAYLFGLRRKQKGLV